MSLSNTRSGAPVLQRLNDLDPDVRRGALEELMAACEAGQFACQPPNDLVNMHCHTFFSYNGYGHSPTSLAWMAKERGWYALGTVDFDVLDAVEEVLEACDRVAVRAAAGVETRVYVPEFATREINSPGEPGICYFVGEGFVGQEAPPDAAHVLRQMRERAAQRTRDMVGRINQHLAPVRIDYDGEVLPLTPSGNATERHVLVVYDAAARRQFPRREDLITFWSERLGTDRAAVDASLGEEPGPNELLRSKLMKQGSVGYVQPDATSFPPLSQVARTITDCGAIPSYAWLDGSSKGEQALEELLELMVARGVGALTIIPERNWRFDDPAKREAKVRELYRVVDLARALDLPIIIGTEMNKAGQPPVDDLDAVPLRPLREIFVQGANIIYGHTLLQRTLRLGYQSSWAVAHLPARRERNSFYEAVGRAVPPGARMLQRVTSLDPCAEPVALLEQLKGL